MRNKAVGYHVNNSFRVLGLRQWGTPSVKFNWVIALYFYWIEDVFAQCEEDTHQAASFIATTGIMLDSGYLRLELV